MNTTISNRIYIEDPSDEIVSWVKENLKFPNPAYEKKVRMGFWVGKTPKELRLYEWNGNVLILPFGVCREIMPMLRGSTLYTDFRQDSIVSYGGKDMGLYDYQKEAVIRMMEAKYGILKAKPGSGKTQIGIALIKAHRRRALWLCHTADLLNQSRERAERYIDPELIGTITEGKVNVGVGVTFATVQTMANLELTQYRDYWDVVIVDECFPGNTNIITKDGIKKINEITTHDKVLTLGDNDELVYQKVKTVFKKIPNSMVRIALKDKAVPEIYCTANHPILTRKGYKRADELTDHDEVCRLWDSDGHFTFEAADEIQLDSWKRQGLLFGRVQKIRKECMDGRTTGTGSSINDQVEQGNCFKKNEGTQSDAQCEDERAYVGNAPGDESQAKGSWWKRHRKHRTTNCSDERYKRDDPGCGVCSSDKNSKRERVSNELQIGHCDPRTAPRNRSRRRFSLFPGKAGTRPEERFTIEFVGVDRVEVQEQTCDGTYGGLCGDGYVYNLEVEGNHNYFANYVNVHNCHRVSASATTFTRYEKVLNHLSARHRYGLSATPERSDGLIKATFALIGKVMYEVPDSAVADRTMGVKIRKVETDTEITDECLNTDGTINYVKLIEYLTTDNRRNMLICNTLIAEQDHSCLILSDRLAQLEWIMEKLPEFMRKQSAFINGKMQSKKAKAEREQAIEDMRTGEKKYLFASVSLCREGLDIPRLDRLFFASPVKFSAVVTQAVGRVQRTFPGKDTPIVYDFVDTEIGFCERAYKERCRSYRKIGAEIEKGFLK